MPDILHRVGIKSPSPHEAYKALTTIEGLSAWWTHDTKGDSQPGGQIRFRFGSRGGFDMKVVELEPDMCVLWQVVDGPLEWMGTKVRFDLRQDRGYTIILFKHLGWNDADEFMHHCTTKWGMFLMSLKSLVETGRGAPYPNDVLIDDWK